MRLGKDLLLYDFKLKTQLPQRAGGKFSYFCSIVSNLNAFQPDAKWLLSLFASEGDVSWDAKVT